MANDLMARYAAEAQAEAKAERHDDPKPVRRGDYTAQAVLDYHVSNKDGAAVQSNRWGTDRPSSR
jgi:hypothetical protein